jgi:hypothetical protein
VEEPACGRNRRSESHHGRGGQGAGQPNAGSPAQPVRTHPQAGPRDVASPGGGRRQHGSAVIGHHVADAAGDLADRGGVQTARGPGHYIVLFFETIDVLKSPFFNIHIAR